MNYTDLELKVVGTFGAFMNYDTLEDNLSDNCTVVTAKEISHMTRLDIKSVKGVLSSLEKKGLLVLEIYNINQKALMVTNQGIIEYFNITTHKEERNMLRAIERATGIEYNVKKIDGGFEVYTLEGEKYKKLKESTFKRYFKPVKNSEKTEEPEPKAVEEPEYDEPEEAKEEPKVEKKSKKTQKSQQSQKKEEPVIELDGVNRDNMVSKIKKMLALGENNPSVEEATSAVLMAQKLMAKYNIHEDEVTLEEITEDEIGFEEVVLDHMHLHTWRKSLGIIVAKNFKVKCYMNHNNVTFRGFKDDVKIAAGVYRHLYVVGDRLAARKYFAQLKETGSGKGVYDSFIVGFLHGIEEALNEQCTALMVIVPKAVEEEYEAFASANLKQTKVTLHTRDNDLYKEGKEEGKAVVKSRQLENKKRKGGK